MCTLASSFNCRPQLPSNRPFNKLQIAAHKHMPPARSASSSGPFYEARWEKHGCRHLMGGCKGDGGGCGNGRAGVTTGLANQERKQPASPRPWGGVTREVSAGNATCAGGTPSWQEEGRACWSKPKKHERPKRGSMRGSVHPGSQRTVWFICWKGGKGGQTLQASPFPKATSLLQTPLARAPSSTRQSPSLYSRDKEKAAFLYPKEGHSAICRGLFLQAVLLHLSFSRGSPSKSPSPGN